MSPFMGLGAAVKGLIVMLLGGLGNVPGAMVAGLMLGMIEILSAALHRHHGARPVLVPDPHPHPAVPANRPVPARAPPSKR